MHPRSRTNAAHQVTPMPGGALAPGSDWDLGDGARALKELRLLPPVQQTMPAAARALLDELVELQLVDSALVGVFLGERGERLTEYTSQERFGLALVHGGLLTEYQLHRVLVGEARGLVLGNYRVLDALGTGGMGVVYRAEHRLMGRRVAVKVLPVDDDCPAGVRQRFYAEMRLLAELNHPNIVLAFDAGEIEPAGPNMPGQIYLVMELVAGGDLEKLVVKNGPCDIARGCDLVRQAASGLQAAHDRHLIHRDIKPSNLLLTSAGQVKLVDFGLARSFSSRLTDPRALLGSVEFMAPEQSHDPSAVGKEADIYALGATLFWLLTGEGPYPFTPSVSTALQSLREKEPRHLRELVPDVPAELDQLVARMLDRNPARRPAMPMAIARSLTAFILPPASAVRVATLEAALHLGESQDPAVLLAEQLLAANRQLQQSLDARSIDLREAHNAILFTMAKMAESRDGETAGHLQRLQRYTRALALAAARSAPWAGLVDERFLEQLERCVPLHDIGKIGLPDHILLKPASLNDDERALVETHPLIGDRILEGLAREHGAAFDFLGMARSIVRHHHERFDGRGYPDRLAGDEIPAAARLAALADVYDALRRQRLHKPAMTHAEAVHVLLDESAGQFDPSLLAALKQCHDRIERIYCEIGD